MARCKIHRGNHLLLRCSAFLKCGNSEDGCLKKRRMDLVTITGPKTDTRGSLDVYGSSEMKNFTDFNRFLRVPLLCVNGCLRSSVAHDCLGSESNATRQSALPISRVGCSVFGSFQPLLLRFGTFFVSGKSSNFYKRPLSIRQLILKKS